MCGWLVVSLHDCENSKYLLVGVLAEVRWLWLRGGILRQGRVVRVGEGLGLVMMMVVVYFSIFWVALEKMMMTNHFEK